MDSTFSIVCNTESVVCALLQHGQKGLELTQIDVLDDAVDLRHDHFHTSAVRRHVENVLVQSADNISRVKISLPSSVQLRQYVPYLSDTTSPEAEEMLHLELVQNAPGKSVNQYDVQFFAVHQEKSPPTSMLTIMTERQAMELCEQMVQSSGIRKCSFTTRHQSVYNAFRYNYPEHQHQRVALLGVNCDELELAVFEKGNFVAYNVSPIREGRSPEQMCGELLGVLKESSGKYPERVMVYGDGLRPSLLTSIQHELKDVVEHVERLNAFRLCTTSLDSEQRIMAGRMAHRFAIAVGSAMRFR